MAIGIVDDSAFDAEVSSLCLDKKDSKVVDINRGRGHKTEVPDSVRKLIAESAIVDDVTAKSLSEQYGVSQSSIAAYKNGATSTASYQTGSDLRKYTNKVREKVTDEAVAKIQAALAGITSEKMKDAKLKDLSTVAKDMSAVVRNMEPKAEVEVNNNTNYVFYAPRINKEQDYEVVDAVDE